MQSRPLDYPITELEIRTAVKKLKNNRSSYSDKIRNEMIKASLNEMMPVYHKLFNNVLNGGSMPLMWCSVLITPIFKSGVRNDPTNYRGICVSCCLGKLFCSILNRSKAYGTCQLVKHTSQFSNRFFTKQPNGGPRSHTTNVDK